jgi:purine-nucleoside phosphorylase
MSIESVATFRKKRTEALQFIQENTDLRPNYMLILGTGLGQLAEEMEILLNLLRRKAAKMLSRRQLR